MQVYESVELVEVEGSTTEIHVCADTILLGFATIMMVMMVVVMMTMHMLAVAVFVIAM